MQDNRPIAARTRSALFALGFLFAASCGGGGGGSGGRPPTNLIYTNAAATYDLCGAITPNTPSTGGGLPNAYAITPALPAGLSFDTNSGVISGAPSAIAAAATYTITATNSHGQTSADITLEVAHTLPSGITYPDLGAELGLGVYIELEPQLGAGVGTTWSVNAGSLPSGLALDVSTGVISGVPDTLESAAFSIAAQDCAAASTTDAFAADVVPPYSRGACIADATAGVVRSLGRFADSGSLVHTGRQWNAAATSQLAVHPSSRFVFAAAGGDINVFTVDTRSLELRATALGASIGAASVTDLACSHDGRFLFATSSLGVVYSYAIDTDTGELAATPNASASTGASPTGMVIDTTDSWLYIAHSGDDEIGAYAIDPVDGDLTSIGAVASGDEVRALAISYDGTHLFAGCGGATALYGYDIDGMTGALTAIGWSPASIASSGASALSISLDDALLYVGFDNSTLLRAFDLDALTGEPSDVLFANVDALAPTRQLVIEPRGEHMYSVHDGGVVHTWTIDVTGELSASEVGVTNAGADVADFGLLLGHSAWDPATRTLYAASLAADGVYEYSFNSASGAITALSGTPQATGVNPQTVSVHPYGSYVAVAHQSAGSQRAISVHSLDVTGALDAGLGFGQTASNVGFDFERSGQYGYLVRNFSGGAVLTSYAFDAADGTLSALNSTTFSALAWPPTAHPAGSLLVVPDSAGDQLDVFRLNAQTGIATATTSVSTGGVDPFRAVFDASGRFLYVAHLGSNSIAVFSVDLANATLSPLAGSPFATGVTPLVMGLGSRATALMIADTTDGDWEYYSIDQDPSSVNLDGSLTLAGTGTQAGMALVRFDARDQYVIWVDTDSNRIRTNAVTAPGVLGGTISNLSIGAQITSMALRNR